MLFALSAFPFFPISMGGIGTLFTHADPTAYTAEGKLTQLDSVGLSNYLTWLREDVLDASRFQAELNEDFDDAEIKRLRDALESGERFLDESWKFGVSRTHMVEVSACASPSLRVQQVLHALWNAVRMTTEILAS